jgi:hypothetical protein
MDEGPTAPNRNPPPVDDPAMSASVGAAPDVPAAAE